MRNYTIGDMIKLEGISFVSDKTDYYHKKVFWPDWFNSELQSFKFQVSDMASPTKSFKSTDTYKIQAGYPHEVNRDHKETLMGRGIKRDIHSSKVDLTIPKMDLTNFSDLIQNSEMNVISFTTPKDSQYIRDITLVDQKGHEDLVFIYVVDRKAQIITAWTEKKNKGKYKMQLSKNFLRTSKYKKC